jgi:hypothetical protein
MKYYSRMTYIDASSSSVAAVVMQRSAYLKNSNRKNSMPTMIGTNTRLSTTCVSISGAYGSLLQCSVV